MKIEQYIPGNSVIHSLDPRAKLIMIVTALLFTVLADNFTTLGIIIFILLLMIILTQLQLKDIFVQLRFLKWLLIWTFLIYLIAPQEYSLNQRLYSGTLFSVKLVVLILWVSVLGLTTSSVDLCHGLEYLLTPLKKIKIPIQDIILILHLSLRLIPILFEELNTAIKMEEIEVKKGNILKKIRYIIPAMVLLFKNSFQRADELAVVLESSGDQIIKNRTKKLKMAKKDYLFLSVIGITLVIGNW
ncbi:MAG: energy-coupling factor transporter transmembrane protein EcfT [bacterium]